jgi:methylenetetrahydrofolate dehydrogenase (NADP+)/methenyltetrahydrofolate cyclohydrolase
MIILEGKQVVTEEKKRIKEEVEKLDIPVSLSVILVGEDPASQSYVASKEKACLELGIKSQIFRLSEKTSRQDLIKKIKELNSDPDVNGILVQIPLPDHLQVEIIIETIDPLKDVDCLHPYNLGRLLVGNPIVEPCTPKGIIKILDYYKISLEGKRAVVLGRSNIVGKPIAAIMIKKNATVTICHSKTKEIDKITREADIIIAAIGRPLFLKNDMVKEGAVVIDVGINRVTDASRPKGYRVVGDADYDGLINKVSAITPVPGGIGLMTVAMLMDNVVQWAKYQRNKK